LKELNEKAQRKEKKKRAFLLHFARLFVTLHLNFKEASISIHESSLDTSKIHIKP